ncbi:MAG: (d)CMP kinase [Clostridia bacterium]|nr:(d)CMP kinase [Clostridia bacterium]
MINIAIDGPSGAGKSTIAKMVAKTLGITYLDTGAMYRAVALHVVNCGKNPSEEEDVKSLLSEINISYIKESDENKICLNGIDVSQDIRRHEISKYASEVSKIPAVRIFLVDMQRKIADTSDVVLDGRDITSYVLPNAKYKFYLTANDTERAKRRFEELKAKGQDVSYEQILADVKDRDFNDMNRDFAPLKKTEDSYEIDSTEMSLQQVVDTILSKIKEIDENDNARVNEKKLNNQVAKQAKDKKKQRGRWFYKGIANFVRKVLKVLWITKIYFKENFPKNSKALVICNHYSALDPCVIMSRIMGKDGKVLMKNEITANSFVDKVSKELGCIPVKRGEADVGAVKNIIGALNNNQPVLIFPEGTRNRQNSKEFLPFKQGVATFAIKAKAPIVPMIYYKKTVIFGRNKLMVGTPFYLDEFYDKKMSEVKESATQFIIDKMKELREEMDILVEKCGGSKKRYLKYKENQSKESSANVGDSSEE